MKRAGDSRRAGRRSRGLLAAIAPVLVAAAVLPFAVAPDARAFTIGLDDYGSALTSGAVNARWLSDTAEEHPQLVRVAVDWAAIAPQRPTKGFRAADPASPGYGWTATDAVVRDLAARGISMMIEINGAPTWAEGAGAPSGTTPGTWRPSPSAFGAFARAAATRYSGRFADPLRPGRTLPRVRIWEAWNEPNLSVYLAPQWTVSGGQYVASSPVIYREMLNAFYAAVTGVSRANAVVAGATAPYGDPLPGGARMPPVTFVRDLLCLTPSGARAAGCGPLAHFDVLDHHPYDAASPFAHAFDSGDVSLPDMGKLTSLLSHARRAGTDLPAGHKPLWATELLWTTKPEDPQGVSLQTQAQWLEIALHELWQEGVSAVLWLETIDDPPLSANPANLEGGLFTRAGVAKPAAVAFRFPFLATRANASAVRVWGVAPTGGRVHIERKIGSRWVAIRSLAVMPGAVFVASVRAPGPVTLRAQVGTATSLGWPLR